jgi:hypothetical protein
MQKLHGKICDYCRKFIPDNQPCFEVQGKKRKLQFCSTNCRDLINSLQQINTEVYDRLDYVEWLHLRKITKNDEGCLCYCGHTNRCSCADPDFNLFKEALQNNHIILGDPTNGWKSVKIK